jgi:hypothetical protein
MRIRAFSVVAMLMLAACGNHQSRGAAVAHGESRPIAVPEASEDAFASTVHQLLVSEPGSAARETSLAAAVARQMSRATNRFKTRAPEQGLLAVTGGLALVKTGELRPGLLGQNGREAVRLAARELSARGDEGRARALFEILARMWPDTEGADARSHIAAQRRRSAPSQVRARKRTRRCRDASSSRAKSRAMKQRPRRRRGSHAHSS